MHHQTEHRAPHHDHSGHAAIAAGPAPKARRLRIDPVYLILFLSLVAVFAWQFKRFG